MGRVQMKWTFANLMIQTGSGLVGSNIAAAAAHEHRFVAANGSLNDLTHVQITASQAPTGAVVGAIAMMATRFIIKERSKDD